MQLHQDDFVRSGTVFEREMRRRVWNQLLIFDNRAAAERGSDPTIQLNSYSTPRPLNLNDHELAYDDSVVPRGNHNGITVSTFSLISREATTTSTRLNYYPKGESKRQPLEIEENWEKRRDVALGFRRWVEETYVPYMDLNVPVHRMINSVYKIITATLLLISVRPLHRHPRCNPPPISGEAVLSLACDILEKAYVMAGDSSIKPFGWYGNLFNKWHAIAVAAAELCVHFEGPTVERTWAVIEPVFAQNAQGVADSEKGMLWRPVEKLMKRARAIRAVRKPSQPGTPDLVSDTSSGRQMSVQSMPPSDNLQSMNLAADSLASQQQLPDINMSMGDPTALGQAGNVNEWQIPAGIMEMSMGSISDSPQNAWANWESFVNDVHINDADAQIPAPDFLGDMPLL